MVMIQKARMTTMLAARVSLTSTEKDVPAVGCKGAATDGVSTGLAGADGEEHHQAGAACSASEEFLRASPLGAASVLETLQRQLEAQHHAIEGLQNGVTGLTAAVQAIQEMLMAQAAGRG